MYQNNFGNSYVPYTGFNSPNYSTPNYNINPQQSLPQFNAAATNVNQQQQPQTNTNKIYVNNLDDARNRFLSPNSDFIFLDNDKPILYRKTVDATGRTNVQIFKIVECDENEVVTANQSIDLSNYISVDEFTPLKDDIKSLKDEINKLKDSMNNTKPYKESYEDRYERPERLDRIGRDSDRGYSDRRASDRRSESRDI